MEIIVPIKQVPDVALNIKVKDGAVVEEGLSYVISSWDETALEAALQMTEDVGGEVTCLLYTSPSPRDLSTSRMPSSA